jgi:hypothetical protein
MDFSDVCVGIGLGINDERIGVTAIRDPHLRAVQDVAVAFLFGSQLHADNVGPGIRFAHCEGAPSRLAQRRAREVPVDPVGGHSSANSLS